jgi:hypothetical protein
MDLKRYNISKKVSESEAKENKIDETIINKMFLLRFKLMNFVNNAHDLICNQVFKYLLYNSLNFNFNNI